MTSNLEHLQTVVHASQVGALAAFQNKGKTLKHTIAEKPVVKAISLVLKNAKIPLIGMKTDSSALKTLFFNELDNNDHTKIQQFHVLADPIDNLGGLITGLHSSTTVVGLLGSSTGRPPIQDFLVTPRVNKFFIPPSLKEAKLHLGMRIPELIAKVKKHKGIDASQICIDILSRTRHQGEINDLIAQEVEINLKPDGDFMSVVKSCLWDSDNSAHLMMGIGKAFQAFLAAAITRCTDGCGWVQQDFEGNPCLAKDADDNASDYKIFSALDLIPADIIAMAISGIVTSPGVLEGIKPIGDNKVDVSTIIACKGIAGREDGIHRWETTTHTLPES